MEQHVKSPLQKAGVHREHRAQTLLGHAGRHGHGVALGDAHVKKPLGPGGGELLEAGALRHGGGDGADALVVSRQLHQLVAKHIGEIGLRRTVRTQRRVEGGHTVAPLRLALSG